MGRSADSVFDLLSATLTALGGTFARLYDELRTWIADERET